MASLHSAAWNAGMPGGPPPPRDTATALALTLKLLRANQGRPLAEVFHREALAAYFMVQHPDYLEGIRARIIDKDDQPRWQPANIEEVGTLAIDL
jgi:hypothetical protein